MQELSAARAETIAGPPSLEQICLFEAALWGPPTDPEGTRLEMRPAYSMGGFPLPHYRRDHVLILDAGRALRPCGGYMEDAGRDRHVDGCSASPLVMPTREGDPRVNHMRIVPGTVQSDRSHRGDRFGIVVRGRGLAHHEAGPPMILYPGRAWKLFAGERHRFETRDESLDVLVFQPDGEPGPEDEAHRMPVATMI